jgi:hypothetical protein
MPVQFSGVDWGEEQYKAEVRFQKRKQKKNKKMEGERLRRFRRFLHGMAPEDLTGRLTSRLVYYFYQGREEDYDCEYVRTRTRLIADLASDDMLNSDWSRHALALLRTRFMELGYFGEADDFLESLFAFSPRDLQALVESQSEIFRGPLELLYLNGMTQRTADAFLNATCVLGTLVRKLRERCCSCDWFWLMGTFL